MNWLIRTVIIHGGNNNLGAFVLPSMTWSDEAGQSHPLVLFHSGFTPDPTHDGSCFRSLIEAGQVRHAMNLYDGQVPLQDLIEGEAAVAEELGASYVNLAEVEHGFGGWRSVVDNDESTPEQIAEAEQTVARLIREQILRPGGEAPRGNLYFHCGGGMHRSAMIMGVLRRCIGQEPMEAIVDSMRYHAAYDTEERPGGFEESNQRFVEGFNCDLLEDSSPAPTEVEETDQVPVEEGAPGV